MSTKTRTKTTMTRLGDLPKNVADRVTTLPKDVAARSREAWLTGLGAIATIEEEGTNAFDYVTKQREKLVKRGEKLENRGRARIEAIKDDVMEVEEQVETTVIEPVMKSLQRLGIPTKAEGRDLAGKVDLLTERVNALLERLETSAVVTPMMPVFTVRSREDGWEVQMEGSEIPVGVFPTKDEAVERGRELANDQAPSQLVVYKKDGTIQDTFAYEA